MTHEELEVCIRREIQNYNEDPRRFENEHTMNAFNVHNRRSILTLTYTNSTDTVWLNLDLSHDNKRFGISYTIMGHHEYCDEHDSNNLVFDLPHSEEEYFQYCTVVDMVFDYDFFKFILQTFETCRKRELENDV